VTNDAKLESATTTALPPLAELKIGRPRAGELPWQLLLDADPSREAIERYATPEWTRVMWHEGAALGVYVLARRDTTCFELESIAVDPRYRRRGIGRWLLGHAIGLAESKGARAIEVGIGDSSFDAFEFLQRAGFRIVENGTPCRDRVLRLDLEPE